MPYPIVSEELENRTCINCGASNDLFLVSSRRLWVSVCDSVLVENVPHFVLCQSCYEEIKQEQGDDPGEIRVRTG